MKKIFVLLILILITIFLVYVFAPKIPTATINNHAFRLYLAKTPKEKEIGLSKYNSLPKDFGMLFIFDNPGPYPFWMKHIKFPIDIIFINKSRIVTIHSNVTPPRNLSQTLSTFYPKEPSDMVLEINANLSEKYGFKLGDSVKINNL